MCLAGRGNAHLGPDADDYRLVVDGERGVILSWEAMIDGQAARRQVVSDVRVDEPLPDHPFEPRRGSVS